ncbi:hypothetical protein OHS33_04635 [Streptomyces sp. NBC_00536]|nr:hypothetical protein OHS33_04635 [Streptomyces sp. NBC_00536]
MTEGLLRHCTDAEAGSDCVDTRGAPVVGFAHRVARLPAAAPAEEHRQHPPVPA